MVKHLKNFVKHVTNYLTCTIASEAKQSKNSHPALRATLSQRKRVINPAEGIKGLIQLIRHIGHIGLNVLSSLRNTAKQTLIDSDIRQNDSLLKNSPRPLGERVKRGSAPKKPLH